MANKKTCQICGIEIDTDAQYMLLGYGADTKYICDLCVLKRNTAINLTDYIHEGIREAKNEDEVLKFTHKIVN